MSYRPDVSIEIFVDGAWLDITPDVLDRDVIQIRRGRTAESNSLQPSQLSLSLNNASGRYWPHNPLSDLFGKIGRNTPIRVREGVSRQTVGVVLYGSDVKNEVGIYGESSVSSPGGPQWALSSGDLDVRIHVDPAEGWRPAFPRVLASIYDEAGNRSWALWLETTGDLTGRWSTDGSALFNASSTVPVPDVDDLAVRWTQEHDAIGGDNTWTFYTADDLDSTWTQLGSPLVSTGPAGAPIFNTPEIPLNIGSERITGNDVRSFPGILFGFELRDGVDGTVLTRLDFDTAATIMIDDNGNVFTFRNITPGTDKAIRFTGEISDWPQNWDPTDTDRPTPITANGITRRTSQWNQSAQSAVVAALSTAIDIEGYWPCEDQPGSTSFVTVTPGVSVGEIAGDITIAGYTELRPSLSLPVIKGDDANPGTVTFVPHGSSLSCIYFLDFTGTPQTGTILHSINVTGTTLSRVEFEIISSTVGRARGYDSDGFFVDEGDDVVLANIVDKQVVVRGTTATVTSLDIQWFIVIFYNLDGTEIDRSTITGLTPGEVGFSNNLVINPDGDALGAGDQLAFGHIMFARINFTALLPVAFLGSLAEPAAVRAQRISQAAGIPLGVIGDARNSIPMGSQSPGTVQETITECVIADQGMLFEARDASELRYRIREDLYNQDAKVTVDYANGVFATQPIPIDDDRTLNNDITVSTPLGGLVVVRQETGPLSVQDPPNGVGRYIDTVEVNLQLIGTLTNDANWRLLLGTVDEPRYPSLDLQMAAQDLVDEPQQTAVEDTDVGDRIVVQNLPATVTPDDVSALMIGQSETYGIHTRRLMFITTPAAPYQIAEVAGGAILGTLGSDSATLNEVLDTTETGVDIDCGGGPDWVHEGTNYGIVIGGERMTVTAVSAAAGTFPARTHTLTVTRSVNGVIKTHVIGDDITMADPVYIGL